MKKRLHWFSPLPPTASGIASFTKLLLPALQERYDLKLWADQEDIDPAIEKMVTVRRFRSSCKLTPEINRADLTVFNLGNDAKFHAEILRVCRQHAGLVILHDGSLRELVTRTFEEDPVVGRRAQTHRVLYRDGGRQGSALLPRDRGFGEALSVADGAVIHNADLEAALRAFRELPVSVIPLPVSRRDPLPEVRYPSDSDVIRLLCFGYLRDRNRRIPEIITSLATFPERDRFHLDIVGELTHGQEIRDWVKRVGCQELVSIHGSVDDDQLDAFLQTCHLVINLRNPDKGEASSSVLRAWQFGRPVAVSNTGWYARQPASAVVHVSCNQEREDLHRCYDELLDDPQRFVAMGKVGRACMEEFHTVEAYIDHLDDAIELTLNERGKSFAGRLANETGLRIAEAFPQSRARRYLSRRIADEVDQWIR